MLNILNGGMPMRKCTWLSVQLLSLDCDIFHSSSCEKYWYTKANRNI